MRILVTGGTGFVGSHSVKALLDAGHEVRLLVRSPGRLRPALGPLGVGQVDHVVGDATDPAAVRRAMEGCQAVLHAASVYAFDRRRAAEMASVNPRCAEVVLGTARERGLDPIVHVSSFVALLPPERDRPLDGDSPVGHPAGPYARSKVAAERIARRMQEEGAPVVITYPGSVWGPHDPYVGETAKIVLTILRGRMPLVLPGALPAVDVRDVAAAHAALMQQGLGPRRFLLVAGNVTFAELIDLARRASGRSLPAVRMPHGLAMRVFGHWARVPSALEGPWLGMQHVEPDSSRAERELGVHLRPPRESVEATLRWLQASGHPAARRVGLRPRALPA